MRGVARRSVREMAELLGAAWTTTKLALEVERVDHNAVAKEYVEARRCGSNWVSGQSRFSLNRGSGTRVANGRRCSGGLV